MFIGSIPRSIFGQLVGHLIGKNLTHFGGVNLP